MSTRFDRLGAQDLTNLAVEAADTPMHVGVVALLDGGDLLDADGRLRLAAIRRAVAARLDCVPSLRKVVHRPRPPAGRPLWVDDPAFAIERHVGHLRLDPPGGEEELLRLTERVLQPPLDRSHPLWRVWLVTGLADGRVAVVVKLHHAVADGLAAVRLVARLLDAPPGAPRDTAPLGAAAPAPWVPSPPPRWGELVRDNLAGHASGAARLARRLTSAAGLRRSAWAVLAGWRALARARGAPRTSLNGPIGGRRRLAVIRLDLASVKEAGHAYHGKVNDVVLALVAGGLRGLLVSRGTAVDGLVLRAAVAVSLRTPEQADGVGNVTGGLVVRLPLGTADPGARLAAIAAETASAKRSQVAGNEQRLLAWFAKSGLMRYFTRHQRLTNVVESNVTGPAEPVRVLGARVADLVPVGVIAGNLAITFLAFSYAGRLSITVWCDADRFPDLPVVVEAMRSEWATLAGSGPGRAGRQDPASTAAVSVPARPDTDRAASEVVREPAGARSPRGPRSSRPSGGPARPRRR
jgi:diacylglycerol O-acyltransferase / wax synthase